MRLDKPEKKPGKTPEERRAEKEPFVSTQAFEPGTFDAKKAIPEMIDDAIKGRNKRLMKKRYSAEPPTPEQQAEFKRRYPDN